MDVLTYGLRFAAKALMLTVVLLVIGFIVFANAVEEGNSEVVGRAHGIVVLTGGTARIAEAVRLLSDGRARRLLISGVHPDTTSEEIAQLIPDSAKLFECCIDLDKRAQNTMDNASEARDWAQRHDFESLIVVTSSYHMPRSLAELARTMPNVVLTPYAVTPRNFRTDAWWTDARTMRLLFTEYLKYLPAVTLLNAARLTRRIGADGGLSAARGTG